jgi:hypothetical protein
MQSCYVFSVSQGPAYQHAAGSSTVEIRYFKTDAKSARGGWLGQKASAQAMESLTEIAFCL